MSLPLKITGSRESRAKTASTETDHQETASLDELSWCSVVPAWMATNDGGATPTKVPRKKGAMGTSMTGAVMLMNQLGRNGVMRKKIM